MSRPIVAFLTEIRNKGLSLDRKVNGGDEVLEIKRRKVSQRDDSLKKSRKKVDKKARVLRRPIRRRVP